VLSKRLFKWNIFRSLSFFKDLHLTLLNYVKGVEMDLSETCDTIINWSDALEQPNWPHAGVFLLSDGICFFEINYWGGKSERPMVKEPRNTHSVICLS
jgi:hypothetical protein